MSDFTKGPLLLYLVYGWKKYVGDDDGGDDTDRIRNEGAGDGVSGLFDANGTEIDGDDIERCVGGSLEHATEATGKAVRAQVLHGVDHHAAGTAAAEGFHEGGGECGDDVVSDSDETEQSRNAVHDEIHRAARAEHCDAHENRDEVRDDHHGGVESFLGAFDERFVGLNLAVAGEGEECDNDAEQYDAAHEEACGADGLCGEVAKIEHQGDDAGADAAEPGDRYGILELDFLEKAEGEDTRDGAEKCG